MMSATAIFSLVSMPKPASSAARAARQASPGRHEVGDRDLLAGLDAEAGVERRARGAPGLAAHLVVIADDAIDFGHFGKHVGLRLRRAAGDDDAHLRPLALQPPDRL